MMTSIEANKQLQRPNPIFITDTWVLYSLLAGLEGFSQPKKDDEKVKSLLEWLFRSQEVVIPLAAMAEIIGQFFHTAIKTEDYDNYLHWHRKRKVVFDNRITNFIFGGGSANVRLQLDPVGMKAVDLATRTIMPETIRKLNDRYQYLFNKYGESVSEREPKLLDGADSLILAEAVSVALKNKNRKCILVSGDVGFGYAVDDLKIRAEKDTTLPQNLGFSFPWGLNVIKKSYLRY
ncbi:MAG: hypothetical protein ACOYOS_04195 [Syntrophales bacterium]